MVKIFRQFYKVLIITLGQICKNLFLQFYVTTITYPNTLLLSYVKLLIMYTDFLYSWWKNMQAQRNIFKLSGGMPEAYILGVICPLDWNRINKHVKINWEKNPHCPHLFHQAWYLQNGNNIRHTCPISL